MAGRTDQPTPKGKGKLGALIKAHKPEAAAIGVGAGGLAYLLVKKHSASSTAAPAAAQPTTTGAVFAGPSAGDFNALTNQLNGLGDTLNTDFSKLSKGSGNPGPTPPDKDPTPKPVNDNAGVRETNLPPDTARKLAAPIVRAIPGPDGGDLYLAKDGGVFATGGARFYGSYPGLHEKGNRTFVDMYSTQGGGYTEVDSKGELYHFGPGVSGSTGKAKT